MFEYKKIKKILSSYLSEELPEIDKFEKIDNVTYTCQLYFTNPRRRLILSIVYDVEDNEYYISEISVENIIRIIRNPDLNFEKFKKYYNKLK